MSGTAFAPGFMRQSSSGKWVGVLKYRDAAGRWRQVTRTFTNDRAESQASLVAWRDEMEKTVREAGKATRASSPTDGPTVEQAVRACLAAQLARRRIELSTHDMQLACAKRELFPELGALPLTELTPADTQRWVDRMCLRLSPGSARVAYGVLSKTCARAAVQGRLTRNPLEFVEPPPRVRPSRAFLPESSVELLEREVARAWGLSSGRACAVKLALYAGLRIGECCALRWRDVDLAGSHLRVATSVGRSKEGFYLKAPKCPASAREAPIIGPLARALEARRTDYGAPPLPEHFVCGGERFLSPGTLSNAYARLCDRAGVVDSDGRRATFHALRHTFATRAVRAGVDVRTLADLMGHARADVTLNVYAASSEDARRAAAKRLERAFDVSYNEGEVGFGG